MSVPRTASARSSVARIHRTEKSRIELDAILDKGAFDLKRIPEFEPDFLQHGHDHDHGDEVASLSFSSDRPVDPDKFQKWMGALLQLRGQDILRSKGILYYAGEDRRFAFQAVHMLADGDFIGPVKEGDPRRSKIVFIGRDLNRPALRRGFEACQTDDPRAAVEAEVARWSPPPA